MSGQHLVEPTRTGPPRTDAQKVRQRHVPAVHLAYAGSSKDSHPIDGSPVNQQANLTSEKRSNKSVADSTEIWPNEGV
jgi:hypothetical protein